MARRKTKSTRTPTAGWAVYLRTSSDENQKPELSRARQRYTIFASFSPRLTYPGKVDAP